MRPETLSYLRCAICRRELEVLRRVSMSSAGRIRDGLLRCTECRQIYPVIGWVPRLLPEPELTESERQRLSEWKRDLVRSAEDAAVPAGPACVPAPSPAIVDEERLPEAELREEMAARVRSKIVFADASEKMRARAEDDLQYRVFHTEDKAKFVRTAARFLTGTPRRILDVGGGQGGALSAFRTHFRPDLALLLDLDPEWVELAWLRDPETEVIRADAGRMPLADDCIDFMFSSATLEHVPRWRDAVAEMVRVCASGLLCYNPNAGFPYDPGHLDAPLVTWLPRSAAAHVALAWHRLRRTGRTMDSIRFELSITQYIRRSTVVQELRRHDAEVRNAFGTFLAETVRDDYHLRGGRAIRILREHEGLRNLLANLLQWTGTEPNAYLFFDRQRSAPPS